MARIVRRRPGAGSEGARHVVPPRSARDLEGPGRRQHRRLRVREPRRAGHRHAHRQLHPAPGSRRRPELLRVRRRRAVRDPHRQRRRRQGRRHVRVPVHDRDRATANTFLYNIGPITALDSPNWNRRQTYTSPRCAGINRRTVLGERAAAARRATSGRGRRPTTPTLANSAIHDLGGGIKVFAGQRRDGFYVDLGSIFDLGTLRPFQNLHLIPMPGTRRRAGQRHQGRQRAHDRAPGADRRLTARRQRADRSRWQPSLGHRRVDHGAPPEGALQRRRPATTTSRDRSRRCRGSATRCSTRCSSRSSARTTGTRLGPERRRAVRQGRRPPRAREAAAGPLPGRVPEPRRATSRTGPTCWRSC